MCKDMWLGKYPEAEERGGTGLSHFLSSCPPSLRLCVLPTFMSFLPSCPSSLCALPPFMSIDEAEPVLIYLLGNFLSFVGEVHGASPPPPCLHVLPPFVSSLPLCLLGTSLRDTYEMYPYHESHETRALSSQECLMYIRYLGLLRGHACNSYVQ